MNPLLFLLFLFFTSQAFAQTVPSAMTYQGRLTNASGAPVPDGNGYEIEVRLWDAPTGGTLLWGTRYTGVPLRGGAFNLILGSGGTPIPGATTADLKSAFNTNSPSVHLGLTTRKGSSGTLIPTPSEILPRQEIFSTPFAFRAETASSVTQNSVLTSSIKDGEIRTADIGENQITTFSIATGAVDGRSIRDASITSSDIAIGGITMNRISTEYAVFVDEKTNGTSGGASISGWQTRTLNKTTALEGTSISRNGNNITLSPGTYFIDGSTSSYAVNSNQAVFREIATDITAITGTSEFTISSGNNTNSRSIIKGYVTITGNPKTFDVYHYTAHAWSKGLGLANDFGSNPRKEPTIFTQISIYRVK